MQIFWVLVVLVIAMVIIKHIEKRKIQEIEEKEFREREEEYKKLETEVLSKLGILAWRNIPYLDKKVIVKSRQALEKYDDIKFFKESGERLAEVEKTIKRKHDFAESIKKFLENNEYTSHPQYLRVRKEIDAVLRNTRAYRISVNYISSAGNNLGNKEIIIKQDDIDKFKNNPSLLMNRGEYTRLLREQQKEALGQKQCEYYGRVNNIIDYADTNRGSLIIKGAQKDLDGLIDQLFDKTVNSIKKIKTLDSEEWVLIGDFMTRLENQIKEIVNTNQRILEYYESPSFLKIKETCEALMSSQREFNEYINEKVQSISKFFGARVVRSETVNNNKYNYIRPYKKTITPFTAEVSATVFASAENNPLEYIVKCFYPNKTLYPEQIKKLYQLVEELETLKDAKQIIDNYKAEYQQYLGDVPDFVMENDEVGFYSRLGFATVDESVFTVEYRFSYTSAGGMVQKSFPVPMTEEIIIELINVLESKLTASAFAKEQRSLMTKKLREFIKTRDNFTCCNCGNSTNLEPNLLLEIDHIIPVAKGGRTVENNLQTLCWRCNREKSDKIID